MKKGCTFMNARLVAIALGTIIVVKGLGQTPQIDSLKQALAASSNDTARVELLMNLANEEYQAHPDVAFDYSEKAFRLASKANYHSGIADAHGWLAYLELNNRSNVEEAREHYVQALVLWTELAKRISSDHGLDSIQVYQGLSHSIINIGYVDELELDFPSALKNYERGIDLGERYGLHEHVAACYMNIGKICKYQGDLPKALKSYDMASGIARRHGLKQLEAYSMTATGTLWEDNGYLTKAWDHYTKALGIHRQLGDVVASASCLNNLGSVEQELGNWSTALLYYDSAAVLALEVGALRSYCTYVNNMGSALSFLGRDAEAILKYEEALRIALDKQISQLPAMAMNNIAGSYLKLERVPLALSYAERAYRLALDDGILLQQQRSAELLSKIYARVGRVHEAYNMRVLNMLLSDSLQGGKVDRLIARSVMAEEIRMEHYGDSISRANASMMSEQEKSVATAQTARLRATSMAIGSIGTLLITAGGAAFALDRRRRKHRYARRAAHLQTQVWRSQVNPQFIHTALQNINDYVQANERDLASSFLTRFARLMRAVLENARKDEVKLASDLTVMRDYLELEKVRMKDGFQYAIEVDPAIDTEEVMVPPMLLQPFAEEAIWKRLANSESPGHLVVRVRQQGTALVLSLEDDAVMTSVTAHAGVPDEYEGTTITRSRLELLAKQEGRPASVQVVPIAKGQRVELIMPILNAA